MNVGLGGNDWAAISPLMLLFATALISLLAASFSQEARGGESSNAFAHRAAFWVAIVGGVAALGAALIAPPSEHPLLTQWLSFDALARFFTLFFLVAGLASILLASSLFHRCEAPEGEYYFFLFASLAGLLLIGSAADFLTLFLGLETLSISLYVLCGYMKKWSFSHEAAVKYFLLGSTAAAFFLYGVAMLYGAVGTTQFAGLAERYQDLSERSDQVLFLGGIALVTLGLAFKAAIVPFHLWAPDVYHGSPSPVAAFMAVGVKAGAFAGFARLFLWVLPSFHPLWPQIIALLAMATLVYANFAATRQKQLRRFFAYSGISHAGFLLIPMAVGTPEALDALRFYLVVYALATMGSFAILSLLDHQRDGPFLDDLRGLFYRTPLLASLFALSLLTLAGIPPTAGFFAKFYVFKVAFQSGYYALVVVGLLTTIISIFYYLRLVSLLFVEPLRGERRVPHSLAAGIVAWSATVALILLAVRPGA